MPHHEHDCEACTFIGSFVDGDDIMDAYSACKASSHDYIVRYGELGEYITVGEASPYYRVCKALFVHKFKSNL